LLQDDLAAGKEVCLTLENVRRTLDDLTARRQSRELARLASRHLPRLRQGQARAPDPWSADPKARARIEHVAMGAVLAAETALGHAVGDVSAHNGGWDVTSQPPARTATCPPARHLEVKRRAKGQDTLTVTRNEILAGFNQGDKFHRAIVVVDGDRHEGPFYVRQPFSQEPDWATTSVNLNLSQLLARAQAPA